MMKLAIVVRKDLGMSCGKIAVEVGHACVIVCTEVPKKEMIEWLVNSQKKIVLKAPNEYSLIKLEELANELHISTTRVYDAGFTQVEPNTWTALAIGPDEDEKIDEITKGLKLL